MKHYWWLFLAVLGVIGGYLVWRAIGEEDEAPPNLSNELEALEAKASADIIAAKLSEQEALGRIEAKHKETLDNLSEKKKRKAETLRKKPGALAKFLVRAGRK